jgi:hypothetical protein
MNISWGWKIAGLYAGFVVLISVLVYKSMHQRFDLTDTNYYTEEIKYQEVIDAGKNQSALTAPVSVSTDERQVVFDFPKEFKTQVVKADVHFYAPVAAAWDKHFTISTDNGFFTIAKAQLHHARYEIKISWQANGKHYYQESSVNLMQHE